MVRTRVIPWQEDNNHNRRILGWMNRVGQDLKKLRQKPPNKEDQQFWEEGGTALLNLGIWGEWKSSNIGVLFEKCGSEEGHFTYLKIFK